LRLETESDLYRRVLRMHIDEVTKGADIALPGDARTSQTPRLLLWLATVLGLLLYFLALT